MNLLVHQINYGLIKKEFYNKLIQYGLNNNNILICSRHDQGKSVITEGIIKTLKARLCEEMTANESKYYLSYLNKLVDQQNKTYHYALNKKYMKAYYSALIEKNKSNPKSSKFQINQRVRITR